MALHLSAFFVRASRVEVASALPAVIPGARLEGESDGSAFVACAIASIDDTGAQPYDFAALSTLLDTDVVTLVVVEDNDTLAYRRWQRGSLLRTLVFRDQSVVALDGTPEPWEVWALHGGRLVGEATLAAPSAPASVTRVAALIGAYFGLPGAPRLQDLDVERDADDSETARTEVRACPRCRKVIDEPNPQTSTLAYARYWRGVCPACESPLVMRAQ